MPSPSIELTWWKDPKGYRLVDGRDDREPSARRETATGLGGGAVGPAQIMMALGMPARLVRLGGRLEAYRPMATYKGTILARRFAEVKSPTELLTFVAHFGPLTQAGLDCQIGEDVDAALRQAEAMRYALLSPTGGLARLQQDGAASLGAIDAVLVAGPKKAPRMQFVAHALLTALWVRVGEHLAGASSGPAVRQCKHCGTLFDVGPTSKPRRRLDARFCCDAHRVAFNSQSRARGRHR